MEKETVTKIRIGNTLIRVSDKYAAKTTEEVSRALERIASLTQPELAASAEKNKKTAQNAR